MVGVIVDVDDTYIWMEIFFMAWLGFSILITALMWFIDYRQTNYLFMNNKQRKVFETTPEYLKIMYIEKTVITTDVTADVIDVQSTKL